MWEGMHMSTIDDIIGAVEGVVEKIEEAVGSAKGAESETDDALGAASALGATSVVEGLSRVREQLETLVGQLGAASDTAGEAASTARAVADGT
jgi:hypothetical protein